MGCCASVSAVQVPNPSRCQLGESRYELIAVMFLSYESYEVSVSSSLECSSLLSSLFSQACSKFDHFICRKNMQPLSYSESYDFRRYTQKGFVSKAGRVKIHVLFCSSTGMGSACFQEPDPCTPVNLEKFAPQEVEGNSYKPNSPRCADVVGNWWCPNCKCYKNGDLTATKMTRTYMGLSRNGGTQQLVVFLLKMTIWGCFGGTTI